MYYINKTNSSFTFKKSNQEESAALQKLNNSRNQNTSCFPGESDSADNDSSHLLFISVRKKINLDEFIESEDMLSDSEILNKLEQWDALLKQHHIMVVFTDHPVDHRRRYRFLSEEFFAVHLPVHPFDMQFCFLYDIAESHCGEYFNQETVRGIIQALLNHEHIDSIQQLNKRVRLNTLDNLSEPELYYVVNKYKRRCHQIINRNILILGNKIRGNRLIYKGTHETDFCFDDHCSISRGRWQLEMIAEQGNWLVVDIQVEGVNF